MKPIISINLVVPAPYLPIEEYCRLTGHAKSTVLLMVSDGRLTIKHKADALNSKTGRIKVKAKVEINMVEQTLRALHESGFDARLSGAVKSF
ncbi:regulator [Sodalis sp. dw_96]|uniref:regulator n=1 Tax=Sodalis sp. dw_96 TaxID=2719794 RepID=UPI001C49F1E3|nr:regulator [Sodalis sp. dw_96]